MSRQSLGVEAPSKGANNSKSEPCSGRSSSQVKAASGDYLLDSVHTCPSSSSEASPIFPNSVDPKPCTHIDCQPKSALEDLHELSAFGSKKSTTICKPHTPQLAIEGTKLESGLSAIDFPPPSSPPSPSTIVGFSDGPTTPPADSTTALTVETNFDRYRMARFLDELPEFWYKGQGGREKDHVPMMKVRLDVLLNLVG